MHKSLLTLCLCVGLSVAALAPQAAEQLVRVGQCEYSVQLPEKPVVKPGRRPAAGIAAGPSLVGRINNRVPAYRVECQTFAQMPPNARQYMLEDAEEQARGLGLKDLQFSIKDTRLGTVFEYYGIDVQARHRFVVTGRTILGRQSVFLLEATEPAANYPSGETRRVFDSIRR